MKIGKEIQNSNERGQRLGEHGFSDYDVLSLRGSSIYGFTGLGHTLEWMFSSYAPYPWGWVLEETPVKFWRAR